MIAIIDITGKNLTSITNALDFLQCEYTLTHDALCIKKSSHVILPGVGTAGNAMKALEEHQLIEVLKSLKQPILGICLGMQLLMEYSEEDEVSCLGIIPGRVEKIQKKANYPLPHMGWSRLKWTEQHPILQGLDPNDYLYFVHSFALGKSEFALATCEYSEEFTAIVHKDNAYGMQFHPEKSDSVGMKLLNNFISLEASC